MKKINRLIEEKQSILTFGNLKINRNKNNTKIELKNQWNAIILV